MTAIAILQFSPVQAYFCSGWGNHPKDKWLDNICPDNIRSGHICPSDIQ